MSITLQNISPNPGATRPRKRIGRGHGSGTHKTSGKGTKGQKARTGHHGTPKPGFEGGQTAMARRLPKRGFKNPFRKSVFPINLGDIAAHFVDAGTSIDLDQLRTAGLVPRSAQYVKVLGRVREGQSVAKQLAVHAHFISASARKQLEALSGTFHEIAVGPKAKTATAA